MRECFASWPADNLVTLNRPLAQAMRGHAERSARRVVRSLREAEPC
jgi:hypothetical protein